MLKKILLLSDIYNIHDQVKNYFESWIFCLKEYCGAPIGPNFVIFGIMVHDLLYFKVGIFRDQPTPPICLKIPKCANFSTLWVSGEKNRLKVGVHRKKLWLEIYPRICSWSLIYVGTVPFNFRQNVQLKIFSKIIFWQIT